VIPFETDAEAAKIDAILGEYEWMIPGAPDDPVQRREFWLQKIDEALPEVETKLEEWARARREAESVFLEGELAEAEAVSARQKQARELQAKAIEADRAADLAFREVQLAGRSHGNGHGKAGSNGHRPSSEATLVILAAREAKEILRQIADDDQELARINFQYPIYDRRTQSFGTVHYELKTHESVIRLRNSHSEKLKIATGRLVEDLVRGKSRAYHSVRIVNVAISGWHMLKKLWFRSERRHRRPIAFSRIRVLEQNKSNEAFSGTVIPERTFASVARERKSDITVASVLLFLAMLVLFLSSPWAFNLDFKQHHETWTNGWLAWGAGNASRIGSAFFVGIFLPLIQVFLHWRNVRRKASVSWNIDVAQL
jgi:hypothetical protein